MENPDYKAKFNALHTQQGPLSEYLTDDVDTTAHVERATKLICHAVPIPLLILGETGTGKDVLARHLHAEYSKKYPTGTRFVNVNCAALTGDTATSKLFGHEKGSFTGAIKSHVGYLEEARGGILFLDEVAELPLEIQTMFLNALDHGIFRRAGGNKEIQSHFRLISATNKDLGKMVAEGTFREELYQRLAGDVITLKPLRERSDDIDMLSQYFAYAIGKQANLHEGASISPVAANLLKNYSWPGNIRELLGVMKKAVIFETTNIIERKTIAKALPASFTPLQASNNLASSIAALLLQQVPYSEIKARVERHVFHEAQKIHDTNDLTFKALDMDRSAFYKLGARVKKREQEQRTPKSDCSLS